MIRIICNTITRNFFKNNKDLLIQNAKYIEEGNLQNNIFKNNIKFLENGIYYTPLIQKLEPSLEFLEFLYDFSFKKDITNHQYNLVHSVLQESLDNIKTNDNTELILQTNYKIKERLYYADIDFLIFDQNKNPVLAVLLLDEVFDDQLSLIRYNENEYYCLFVLNYFVRYLELKGFNLLLTNRHNYKLFKGFESGMLHKTKWYQPKVTSDMDIFTSGDTTSRCIYNDEEYITVVLGLVRYSCNIKSESEKQLAEVYEYLDDLKYIPDKSN